MTKTWCVGRKHYSNTNNIIEYEKKTLELKNSLKLLEEVVVFADVVNQKLFSK